MKHEFEERVGQEVTSEQWETIHTVYQFHPVFDEVQGKDQIAGLYKEFGMLIIEDMVYRAEKISAARERQQNLRKQIQNLDQEIQGLDGEIMVWSTPER